MSRRPELRGRAARLARLLPAGPSQAARTPFVLLVVVLLAGGLITLLMLNSALNAGSFRLNDLKKETTALTEEEQALQRDVDAYSAPEALQRRARELGMVPGGSPAFLNPDGTVKGMPGAAATPSGWRLPSATPPEAVAGNTVPPSPAASGTPSGAASAKPSAAAPSAPTTKPSAAPSRTATPLAGTVPAPAGTAPAPASPPKPAPTTSGR
ncbi:septum formation initiator family protein [Streptomyces himalayensis]|uniref:Septum formation initiator family protein n=1 Tax=Streptomyces himalayensis subsp. himalayensis TaxID=2756131 RepID=A0A7W0DP07_9ACTN|nr:septum formation initiator family protein [Streptomyces himalayensis]MBA2948627.1 septum formation initiator family protein [Streptomyces himalayensis subsp. himalayensis]